MHCKRDSKVKIYFNRVKEEQIFLGRALETSRGRKAALEWNFVYYYWISSKLKKKYSAS